MRGVIAKNGPKCFFYNFEGPFKSDCPQFWDDVADIKHPRHEEPVTAADDFKIDCRAAARDVLNSVQ